MIGKNQEIDMLSHRPGYASRKNSQHGGGEVFPISKTLFIPKTKFFNFHSTQARVSQQSIKIATTVSMQLKAAHTIRAKDK